MILRILFFLTFAFNSSFSWAEFIGTLELTPKGCETSGECRLLYDFGYRDSFGIGWQAKAGLKTDGASIPKLAQPIIGGPWDEQFIRAAVLHDHYCIRTVRRRTQTHRMFYDALKESGVSRLKAGVMYYAVLVGSHMWIRLMEGQPCNGIEACIQSTSNQSPIPDTIIRTDEAGQKLAYRKPRFDDPTVMEDIENAGTIILGGGYDDAASIEALAHKRNPTDFFLNNGDTILYQDKESRYPTR